MASREEPSDAVRPFGSDGGVPLTSSSFVRPRLSMPSGWDVELMREQFLQQPPRYCFTARQQPKRVELFLLLEEPSSSRAARYFSIVIFVCIILSIAQFMMETMPELSAVPEGLWLALEALFTAVFLLEYLCRLLVCDVCGMSPAAFIKAPMNLVDLMAVIPFFVMLILQPFVDLAPGDGLEEGGGTGAGLGTVASFIRAVRLVRLFCIFKLARYSTGLKMMLVALGNSGQALNVLIFFLGIGCILFSSLVYHMENLYCPDQKAFNSTVMATYRAECSDKLRRASQYGLCCNEKNISLEFPSVLSGFYWTMTTMSTVGYGDVTPRTNLGRFAGGVTMCSGILLFALPIALIGARFQEAYNVAMSSGSPSLQISLRKKGKEREEPLKAMSTRMRLLRFSNTSSTRAAKELSKDLEEIAQIQHDIRVFERAEKELQRKVLQHGLVVVQRLQHHVDGARRPPETGPVKEPDESQTLLGPLPNQLEDSAEEERRVRKTVSFVPG